MQINELPTIPQAPADADVMAIEVNGITFKVSQSALAAAIISKIGDPVGITHGGTGAANAATARTNLGITPANIGALSLSGGTMTGDINMGQSTASTSAKRIVWTTADGTVFRLRPYNNLMQLIRQVSGGSESNVIGINSDGTYSIGNTSDFRTAIGASSGVWPVSLGGTGSTSEAAARASLSTPYTAYVNVSTWGTLFPELNKISNGGGGVLLLSPDASSVLSDGKVSAYLVATIIKTGADGSYTFRITASSDTGANKYAWKVTSANVTSRTTGTVYHYSGTAMT